MMHKTTLNFTRDNIYVHHCISVATSSKPQNSCTHTHPSLCIHTQTSTNTPLCTHTFTQFYTFSTESILRLWMLSSAPPCFLINPKQAQKKNHIHHSDCTHPLFAGNGALPDHQIQRPIDVLDRSGNEAL